MLGWNRTYFALDTRLSGLILGSALAYLDWRPGTRLADWLGGISIAVLV